MPGMQHQPEPNEGLYDEILARTLQHGPSLANGLTNHAPMVVEAFWSLGRADAARARHHPYRACRARAGPP